MKNITLITVFTLFLSVGLQAQSWKYHQMDDVLGGKTRVGEIVGRTSNRDKDDLLVSYYAPLNVLDIQIESCEAGGKVEMRFDNDDEIYIFTAYTDFDGFLHGDKFGDKFEILELMKIHNRLYVKITNDSESHRSEFSLNGSSKAINFVLELLYQKKEEFQRKRNPQNWN